MRDAVLEKNIVELVPLEKVVVEFETEDSEGSEQWLFRESVSKAIKIALTTRVRR